MMDDILDIADIFQIAKILAADPRRNLLRSAGGFVVPRDQASTSRRHH